MNGNNDGNIHNGDNIREFPDTIGAYSDPALARDAYRAYLGELGAISDYIYQSIMLEEYLPELAELFESIAIQEMEHFEELGRLVRNLGGNPSINTRVSSGIITVDNDSKCHSRIVAKRRLANNIESEKASASNYRRLADHTRDERIRTLFLILAEDETRHAQKLTDAYDALDR